VPPLPPRRSVDGRGPSQRNGSDCRRRPSGRGVGLERGLSRQPGVRAREDRRRDGALRSGAALESRRSARLPRRWSQSPERERRRSGDVRLLEKRHERRHRRRGLAAPTAPMTAILVAPVVSSRRGRSAASAAAAGSAAGHRAPCRPNCASASIASSAESPCRPRSGAGSGTPSSWPPAWRSSSGTRERLLAFGAPAGCPSARTRSRGASTALPLDPAVVGGHVLEDLAERGRRCGRLGPQIAAGEP